MDWSKMDIKFMIVGWRKLFIDYGKRNVQINKFKGWKIVLLFTGYQGFWFYFLLS